MVYKHSNRKHYRITFILFVVVFIYFLIQYFSDSKHYDYDFNNPNYHIMLDIELNSNFKIFLYISFLFLYGIITYGLFVQDKKRTNYNSLFVFIVTLLIGSEFLHESVYFILSYITGVITAHILRDFKLFEILENN